MVLIFDICALGILRRLATVHNSVIKLKSSVLAFKQKRHIYQTILSISEILNWAVNLQYKQENING